MNNQFKRGDIVRVKAFSVSMVVDWIESNTGMVGCFWFDARLRLRRAKFPPDLLELADN